MPVGNDLLKVVLRHNLYCTLIWVGWSQTRWLSLDNQFDFCNLWSGIKCDDYVESQISYSPWMNTYVKNWYQHVTFRNCDIFVHVLFSECVIYAQVICIQSLWGRGIVGLSIFGIVTFMYVQFIVFTKV